MTSTVQGLSDDWTEEEGEGEVEEEEALGGQSGELLVKTDSAVIWKLCLLLGNSEASLSAEMGSGLSVSELDSCSVILADEGCFSLTASLVS